MKPSTRNNLPHPGMRGHGRAAITGRRRHKQRAWEKCLVPRMRASTLQPAEGAHRSRRRSPAPRQSWCHGRPPRRARQPRAPRRASAARRRSPRRGRPRPPQCAALPGRRRPPPHAPAPGRTDLSARLLSPVGAAKLFGGYKQQSLAIACSLLSFHCWRAAGVACKRAALLPAAPLSPSHCLPHAQETVIIPDGC